ncbi:ion transporter [Anditalea andensis]|uniref:Ion transporter n=1 Tax=Anditalea andensis TaxID=1048983 RepID=A0A074KQE9_9BACT|nr:ion transporter [Anditalea andensis]KEO72166.1 ion transporter [Anditalea andensis]
MPISKARLAHIVFESDDKASKAFDVVLLLLILGSVVVALVESVDAYWQKYGKILTTIEWVFTIMFTIEYALRVWLTRRTRGYVLSFYGIVDFLAVIPTYLSLFIVGTQFLTVIRALRFLRVLRVLKMGRYLSEANYIGDALLASRRKILIFIGSVLTIVLVMGTIMFIIEGPESGYTSIPMSMYWAIVTLTTVGFGDITPLTPMGKFTASLIMLMGYAIIAVPTGIVSSEMSAMRFKRRDDDLISCPNCHAEKHDKDAFHCKYCGSKL